MNFIFKLFGAPYGFELYQGTENEQNYFQTFDDGSKKNVKLTIHRMASGQVSYSYLRYNFMSGSNRKNAFFGMSLIFNNEYCFDLEYLYKLFEKVYKTILKNKVLLEGIKGNPKIQAKYVVRSFADADSEVKRIENIICRNVENELTNDIHPIDDSFWDGNSNLIRKLNIKKGNGSFLTSMREYSWVSISPDYKDEEYLSPQAIANIKARIEKVQKNISTLSINALKGIDVREDILNKTNLIKRDKSFIAKYLNIQPELQGSNKKLDDLQNQLDDLEKVILSKVKTKDLYHESPPESPTQGGDGSNKMKKLTKETDKSKLKAESKGNRVSKELTPQDDDGGNEEKVMTEERVAEEEKFEHNAESRENGDSYKKSKLEASKEDIKDKRKGAGFFKKLIKRIKLLILEYKDRHSRVQKSPEKEKTEKSERKDTRKGADYIGVKWKYFKKLTFGIVGFAIVLYLIYYYPKGNQYPETDKYKELISECNTLLQETPIKFENIDNALIIYEEAKTLKVKNNDAANKIEEAKQMAINALITMSENEFNKGGTGYTKKIVGFNNSLELLIIAKNKYDYIDADIIIEKNKQNTIDYYLKEIKDTKNGSKKIDYANIILQLDPYNAEALKFKLSAEESIRQKTTTIKNVDKCKIDFNGKEWKVDELFKQLKREDMEDSYHIIIYGCKTIKENCPNYSKIRKVEELLQDAKEVNIKKSNI